MANTYRHSGKHIPIVSASTAISSGAIVYQEGWFGVAIKAAATGQSFELDVHGVHRLPVPATTVKGDELYFDDAAEGVKTLTKTATGNRYFGKAASDRDAAGFALVSISPVQSIVGA